MTAASGSRCSARLEAVRHDMRCDCEPSTTRTGARIGTGGARWPLLSAALSTERVVRPENVRTSEPRRLERSEAKRELLGLGLGPRELSADNKSDVRRECILILLPKVASSMSAMPRALFLAVVTMVLTEVSSSDRAVPKGSLLGVRRLRLRTPVRGRSKTRVAENPSTRVTFWSAANLRSSCRRASTDMHLRPKVKRGSCDASSSILSPSFCRCSRWWRTCSARSSPFERCGLTTTARVMIRYCSRYTLRAGSI
mmetsp:Transcript_753/g.1518  ORF Transcript_753/g.1518 Transcript_753/m.1518 type:complete len:255 (+) Transcript_753:868-1632(+)